MVNIFYRSTCGYLSELLFGLSIGACSITGKKISVRIFLYEMVADFIENELIRTTSDRGSSRT